MECAPELTVLELSELDGIDRIVLEHIIDLPIWSQLGLMLFTYSNWLTYKVSNLKATEQA